MADMDRRQQWMEKIAGYLPAITVVSALALALAAYFLLILPQASALLSGAQTEIARLRSRIADDTAYSAALEAQVKDFRLLNTGMKAKVHRVMPLASETPELFVMFDTLAKRNGLALVSIDTSIDAEAATADGMTPVRVTMNVTGGSYPTFRQLLADIERNERISDVESILFVPSSGSYNVILRTYYVDAQHVPLVQNNKK